MYHKVTAVGHLGRDPEMRYLPSGDPVTNFSMATSEKWKDREGNKQERTIWWRVSCFGKQAEIVNEYLKKGRKVLVEGTMVADPKTGNPRIWTGQDGEARASFELKAQTVKFLDGRDSGNNGGGHAPADDEDSGDEPF
jgi:single-strand DNA-binding protein